MDVDAISLSALSGDEPYLCAICLIQPATFGYQMNRQLRSELSFADPEGYCCPVCAARILTLLENLQAVAV